MIEIHYDAREITAALQRLADRTDSLRPALESIGAQLEASAKLNFRDQHDPGGDPWAPLRASTLRQRRQRGKGAEILRDTGRLQGSITHKADNNSVEIGTNVKYAAIHQFGGTIKHAARTGTVRFKIDKRTGKSRFAKKRRANFEQDVTIGAHETNIQARPFLGVNAADKKAILDIIGKHIIKAV